MSWRGSRIGTRTFPGSLFYFFLIMILSTHNLVDTSELSSFPDFAFFFFLNQTNLVKKSPFWLNYIRIEKAEIKINFPNQVKCIRFLKML